MVYIMSWQDPVKYPENMSAHFKSFLKGLLNKVQMILFFSLTAAIEFVDPSFSLLILYMTKAVASE